MSNPIARNWQLRNWRLRTKLAAVLVVPLVLVGTLASVRVAASVQDARDLDALVGQVAAGQQVARLVDGLQEERVIAETYVAANRTRGRGDLDRKIGEVDAAIAAVTALPSVQFGPAAGDIEAAARVRLADMPALRRAVTGSAFPAERVGAAYTSVIDVLMALESAALTAAPAPLLREAADAVIVATAKEQVRRQHATLSAVLVGGSATTACRRPRGPPTLSWPRRSPSSTPPHCSPPATGTRRPSPVRTSTTASASSSARSPRWPAARPCRR